ncbi:Multidrug efflux pump subunit AcrB [Methylomagnum ishizawai]|uniref:Multidrug efflux pump subunit AcrB n=1 Tax=Methylomagnum ishizawai TaxID=1760988 RepID=A0A1Y6D592_9GAMM|nr:efflux RND transporter permease subunit [Methylomagnum ishizawai]SMF97580.1 Multidrug efflux pump subunit AcrB [Methylomagnum ishizawai]
MTPPSPHPPSSLIGWFAANPVAANLLMLLILIGGTVGALTMDKEVFPRFSPQLVEVRAVYPGAGPVEIEESVCVRIEEAIYDLPGVKRLNTEITEGECLVKVAILPDHDKPTVMGAVRGRVQAIPRLPPTLEKIEVREAVRDGDDGVIWVALHGPTDPLTLKQIGERVQGDLTRIPGVTRALNYNETAYEIAIEVASAKLRQYRLSLREVAEAVRRASLNLAGGLVKTPAGELLLRVNGQAVDGAAIAALVLRTGPEGSKVRLGDVATIRDGLEERLSEWHHNGETGQGWEVHAEHDTVAVAQRIKAYVADQSTQLPQGLALTTWWDDSEAYEERVRTLVEDGVSGFALVCLVLTLFLRLRVALWAGVGILTSIFGALWLMPVFGVSLNMLSLFGFLLAMGILVDDAIIIGESVHSQQESGVSNLSAAVRGTEAVALPVVVSVLIALAAFLPGLFLPGWAGQMMRPICLIMILTLVFSLVEALLILPAHLAAPSKQRPAVPSRLERLRGWLNRGLDRFVLRVYHPFLETALAWRYLTVAVFVVLLLLCWALVASDRVRQSLNPDVTKDSFWVSLSVPPGTPYTETRTLAGRVERALFGLRDEYDRQNGGASPSIIVNLETIVWEHAAGFWIEFSPTGRQRVVVADFVREWRKRIGDLGSGKIDFLYREGDVPYDLEFDLGSTNPALLTPAVERLKQRLAAQAGVYDVVDSAEPGKPEVRLTLKPQAERLGLSLEDLAEQVRRGYYGEEAQRFQRGRNEVKVMVRYPRAERESLDSLRALPVSLPDGAAAPLGTLAEVALAPGNAKLIRQDRRRVLKVQARVDPQLADANALYKQLEAGELPELRRDFPGLDIDIGQERQEEQAMASALGQNTLISLVVIYALIAVPFRSYLKPLIFLLAAPVAWCGAVLAHWAAGLPLSMESMVGMIAASGVVVNDSLVLLDYIRERELDEPASNLVLEACTARFRPILLAFLTNFAGFLPTLLETSTQAQFLIPMTLSLSAGLLLGMAASLVLTPVGYVILNSPGEAAPGRASD